MNVWNAAPESVSASTQMGMEMREGSWLWNVKKTWWPEEGQMPGKVAFVVHESCWPVRRKGPCGCLFQQERLFWAYVNPEALCKDTVLMGLSANSAHFERPYQWSSQTSQTTVGNRWFKQCKGILLKLSPSILSTPRCTGQPVQQRMIQPQIH